MYPQIIVSLLTCCSLVLGSVQPLNTLSISNKSVHEPQPLILPLDDIAVNPVASAAASSTIVNDQAPNSPRAVCDSIVYGQTVYGSIDDVGDEDCFTFTGTANDIPYAQLDSPDSLVYQLALSGPGVTTQSCTSYGSCQIYNVTLSTNGDHTLTVTGSGYGLYTLYLGKLSAPPETITYGETVTGTISVAYELDIYEFNGEAGDEINAYLNSPIGAEFYLKLVIPDGSSNSCFSYDSCLIEDVTLPTTGISTLVVGGSGTYTGSYDLTLGSSEPVGMSIGESRTIQVTPAMPFTVQIDVPSGTDDLFITLQKHATWTSKIELFSGNQLLKSEEHWMDQIVQLPSPAAGIYDLEVSGLFDAELSVLEDLPDLPLSQWVVGTIYNEYGLAWYQCDVPAGQDSLYFYAEALGTGSQLHVYQNTFGGTPYWIANGSSMTVEIPSPAAGRYYVQLSDSALVIGDSQERDHLIKADVLPIDPPVCSQPVVSSFTPSIGGTSMPVTLAVSGQCFEPESSVCLTRQGYSDVCADTVAVDDDGHSLNATFDLSFSEPGVWSLVVTNPDSQSATAPSKFTVESGGEPNLWVEVLGREQIRSGRRTAFYIQYGNSGNIDLYDAILVIKFPADLEYYLPEIDASDTPTIPLGIEQDGFTQIPFWVIGVDAGSQHEVRVDLRVPEDSPIPTESEIEVSADFYAAPRSDFSATGSPDYVETSPTYQQIRDTTWSSVQSYGYPATDKLAKQFDQALLGIVLDRLKSRATSLFSHLASGALIALGFPVAAQVLVVGAAIYSILGWIKNLVDPKSPYRKFASLLSKVISSESPEDKYGPSGHDPPGTTTQEKQRWIPDGQQMNYRVDFWNKEDAAAATADVIITDTLDIDLNWDTFKFTEIGFLDWHVELEPTQYFNVDVANVSIDLSTYYPGEPVVDLVVNVEGTYDSTTGFIEWHFHALDSTTRQPPENPYAGFLPPFTDSGWEIGWVEFSVAQKAGLASGTVIQNQAFVKFDLNEFKPAPKEGPFTNTVDGTPPTSEAQITSGHPQCNTFSVTWTGQDDLNGSGLHGVDLYVDDLGNSDPPYLWLGGLQSDSVIFSGVPGISYGFYTRARDNVGNLEAVPDPISYDALAAVHQYCLFTPMGLLDYE